MLFCYLFKVKLIQISAFQMWKKLETEYSYYELRPKKKFWERRQNMNIQLKVDKWTKIGTFFWNGSFPLSWRHKVGYSIFHFISIIFLVDSNIQHGKPKLWTQHLILSKRKKCALDFHWQDNTNYGGGSTVTEYIFSYLFWESFLDSNVFE